MGPESRLPRSLVPGPLLSAGSEHARLGSLEVSARCAQAAWPSSLGGCCRESLGVWDWDRGRRGTGGGAAEPKVQFRWTGLVEDTEAVQRKVTVTLGSDEVEEDVSVYLGCGKPPTALGSEAPVRMAFQSHQVGFLPESETTKLLLFHFSTHSERKSHEKKEQ